MELTQEDLHYIVRRLPRDLNEMMRHRHLYLAGGCIRSMITNEPISDYDLFGPDKPTLETAAKDLALKRHGSIYTTANAFTVLASPRTTVQFIFRWLYDNPAQLAESFDFTTAQAVIWFQPGDQATTGTWQSWTSPNFYPDLAARRLRYTMPQRNEDAGGSILRVVKFLRKGYNIAPESLGKVIARLVSRIDPETWMATDEKGLATIIIALLREVDPLTVIDGVEMLEGDAPADADANEAGAERTRALLGLNNLTLDDAL